MVEYGVTVVVGGDDVTISEVDDDDAVIVEVNNVVVDVGDVTIVEVEVDDAFDDSAAVVVD